MSPELETLDQLLGGDLPLPIIRGLFGEESRFVRAIEAMLEAGEVRLIEGDDTDVSRWRWREVLTTPAANTRLSITEAGVRRIG
jgi:hypothetical protein